MMTCDIAIVGSGPYGLSTGAHLRRIAGLDVKIFGKPMDFWRNQVPEGMFMRSPLRASDLSDPDGKLTLAAYCEKNNKPISKPIPLNHFLDYTMAFQREITGAVDSRNVSRVDKDPKGFRLTLADGETLISRRVIVATGIAPFARRLPQFQGLPVSLASHSCDSREIKRFRGKRVAVIGAGQSALESAALIQEAGGQAEVIVRSPEVHWLGWRAKLQMFGPVAKLLYSHHDVGPAGVSRIVAFPELVKYFPRSVQNKFRTRALRPAGARWLQDRMTGVKITTGQAVASSKQVGDEVEIQLADGSVRRADHVLQGTGYRIDITRYPFLPAELTSQILSTDGFPQLSSGFESSVPGLHILGAPAAWTYGPLMYFVAGTEFAATTVARYFSKHK